MPRSKGFVIKQKIKELKRRFYISKNQFDSTYFLVYGLGVSLVHLTLFIFLVFAIRFPDVEKAEYYDRLFKEKGSPDIHEQLGFEPKLMDLYYEDITCKEMAVKMS